MTVPAQRDGLRLSLAGAQDKLPVVFNALIGNHDAHAKNFSLLYSELYSVSTPTLAPLYDLLCIAVYPTLTAKMVMKLGSKYRFGEVQGGHWQQFAEAAGLSRVQTRQRLLRTAGQLPAIARSVQAEDVYRQEPLVGDIVTLTEQRCGLTFRRLNAGCTRGTVRSAGGVAVVVLLPRKLRHCR